MKITKYLIALISIFAVSNVYASGVAAKEICFTQYGGGETCIEENEDGKIDVDKKVSDEDGNYQDHLKSSTHQFSAGDKVYFKIRVENQGDVTLRTVELKDTLPDFVEFYKEIDGDARVNGKEIKFDLGTLEPGESETVKFIAKVVEDDELPNDDKVCITNVASAEGDRKDNGDEEKDSDYSNFCINLPEVKGETPTQLPKAGAETQVLALLGTAVSAAGVFFNRKLNNANK